MQVQEIRKACFEGQVAVCFVLAHNELAALTAPMPYYTLLNRQVSATTHKRAHNQRRHPQRRQH
jgi:hypothetical protein